MIKWLRDENAPSAENALKLSAIFGKPRNYFVTSEESDGRDDHGAATAQTLHDELLALISEIDEPYWRSLGFARVASVLLPTARQKVIADAVREAARVEDESLRAEALSFIAPAAVRSGEWQSLLEAAATVGDEFARANVLLSLVDALPASVGAPQTVLGKALELATASLRFDLFLALARTGVGSERDDLVELALREVPQLGDPDREALALARLTSVLPPDRRAGLGQTVEILRGIADVVRRLEALAFVVTSATREERRTLIDTELQALEFRSDSAWPIAVALVRLAAALPSSERLPVVTKCLDVVILVEDESLQLDILERLWDVLTPDRFLLERADRVIKKLSDPAIRAAALVGLSAHLPRDERDEAILTALSWAERLPLENRATTLVRIAVRAPSTAEPARIRAIAAVRAVSEADLRAGLLAKLADSFRGKERDAVIREALQSAMELDVSDWRRSVAIVDVAAHLPPRRSVARKDQDTELVLKAKDGDSRALEALISRYTGFVRLKASSYFLAGGDDDDLIQEGLIGLYKAVRDFRPDLETSFRSFAELCVTRQIITAIKTATLGKNVPLNTYVSLSSRLVSGSDSDEELLNVLPGPDVDDPAVQVAAAEDMKTLLSALFVADLSPAEAVILQLYLGGYSIDEIATRSGRHPNSVRNTVARLRKRISGSVAVAP